MKIGVLGCAGRMGRILATQVLADERAELIGGTEAMGSEYIGHDIAQLAGHDASGNTIVDDPLSLFSKADTIIDFTIPSATAGHAKMASETGTALIVGTTGLDHNQQDAIFQASEKSVVVQAAKASSAELLVSVMDAARQADIYDISIAAGD